jgi:hypothetical protein
LKTQQAAVAANPPWTDAEGAVPAASESEADPASTQPAGDTSATETLPATTTVSEEARQAVLAQISKLTATKKGLALLQGIRKDLKLAPNEEVPLDHRFPYFQVAVQQALAKV